MKRQLLLKTLIAGDASVGKTTLVHRYVKGEFIDTTTMTVGVEFLLKDFLVNDSLCHLQLWDIGGQERFRFMVKKYIPGARGALLLFDTTNWNSFMNIDKWTQLLRIYDKELPIILVGTKYDLPNHEIDIETADQYAEDAKCIMNVWCSSKLDVNIEAIFSALSKWLIYFIQQDQG